MKLLLTFIGAFLLFSTGIILDLLDYYEPTTFGGVCGVTGQWVSAIGTGYQLYKYYHK